MRDDRAHQRGGSNSMLRTFEQVWQLSHIYSDPAHFVSRQQSGSGSSAGFNFVIAIGQRLPVVVADDEARAVVVNRQGGEKRRACSVMADYSVNQRAVMVRMWWPISCLGNQWRSRLFRGASPASGAP